MKEMIILVHLSSKTAYASGNKLFFNASKEELFNIIKNPKKHGTNENFLRWSTKFNSMEDFDYMVIKCPDEGAAKRQSKILMKGNGLTEISLLTQEKIETL